MQRYIIIFILASVRAAHGLSLSLRGRLCDKLAQHPHLGTRTWQRARLLLPRLRHIPHRTRHRHKCVPHSLPSCLRSQVMWFRLRHRRCGAAMAVDKERTAHRVQVGVHCRPTDIPRRPHITADPPPSLEEQRSVHGTRRKGIHCEGAPHSFESVRQLTRPHRH